MNARAESCPNCGALTQPGTQYCENCGSRLPEGFASSSVPAAWSSGAPAVAEYEGSDPLLSFEVEYPERLSRLLIFVKWLLAIPHYVILYLLGIAVAAVWFIAFFAILITGRYPRGLWDFVLLFMRWTANVNAYVLLQRDEYPPFGDAAYPAHLHLEYPTHLSRWKIFLKWLLIIPSLFIFAFVSFAAGICVIIAFFAILITGTFPRGLFDFVTGSFRWGYRISAYTYFLTDRYPPFSMD